MLPDTAVALHAPYLSPAEGTGELHVSPVNKGVNNFVFLSPDMICVSGLLHRMERATLLESGEVFLFIDCLKKLYEKVNSAQNLL